MGRVFKYGDNIDTDVIIPARYLNTQDPKELAKFCMIDIDENFNKEVKEGDFIVAGDNFGCGSSREHAPIAIKASGVKAVIAKNYGRIFFRDSLNIEMPILESDEAVEKIAYGDDIDVDFNTGFITNNTKNEKYQSQIIPAFMEKIIAADGLVNYVRQGGRNE